jgi:hypothetical protein
MLGHCPVSRSIDMPPRLLDAEGIIAYPVG